jgi:Uma2 family endonuclease
VSTQPKRFLTPEEYLEIEAKAEYRSEYYAGEMFAMAGGSNKHSLIKVQTVHLLANQLEGRPCLTYDSDMGIRVSATGLYTYADAVVVCGPSELEGKQDQLLLNPNLIVEVLSPSTEAYDRGLKFEHYRTIPSLTQYVLIASERVHADIFTRADEELWMLSSASKPDDVLRLTSIDCTIQLADLYVRTNLLEPPPQPDPPTTTHLPPSVVRST